MFRITAHNDARVTTLVIEGKLAGLCVRELENCFASIEDNGRLVVDLSSVNFIDDDGRTLLTRLHHQGIKLVASNLLPRCVIEEIEDN